MRRHFISLCLLFLAAIIMASCLNSDNDDVTFYDDAAITAFSLSSVEMTRHTTDSTGTDSTYVEMSTEVSSYNFYIDQLQGLIYNVDSLPVGTNAAKILCTYSTKNNSYAAIKSMTSDTLTYFNTADTIDFSSPRTISVFSTSGLNEKKYTITVNVHKESADSFKWTQYPDSRVLTTLRDMKSHFLNGNIIVMAPVDNATKVYRMNAANDKVLTEDDATLDDANAYKNAVVKGNTMFVLDGNKVKKTQDGHNYEVVVDQAPISRLVAASSTEVYGLTADNRFMASTDDCLTWTESNMDSEGRYVPTYDLSFVCQDFQYSKNTDYVLLVGNRHEATTATDSLAVVWRNIVEKDAGSNKSSWTYMNYDSRSQSPLKSLSSLNVIAYDNLLLAFGGKGINGCKEKAYSSIYASSDGGMKWVKHTSIEYPYGFDNSASAMTVCTDDNDYVWIMLNSSGQVWRGRLNKLGWRH